MKRLSALVAAIALILAACSTSATTDTDQIDSTVVESSTTTSGDEPTTTDPAVDPDPTSTTAPQEPVVVVSGPVEATPAQQEGPYYPVEKLDDRDSDLTTVAGSAERAVGDVVVLEGLLVTTDGDPIVGATIEIWQTDAAGIYLHPGDPSTADRDPNFQFYGEAITDADGFWSFRTILPGEYEPRPRHIHTKVVIEGAVALTTQIYFSSDSSGESPLLVADVSESTDEDGATILTATHVLALDL